MHDTNLSISSEARVAHQTYAHTLKSLQVLWDEVPDDTLMRFRRLHYKYQLNWSERRAAKKDLRRLIETLIERQMVNASDRPLLIAEMNRWLEQTSPRLWQRFCYWRRHHFGPGKWEEVVRLD